MNSNKSRRNTLLIITSVLFYLCISVSIIVYRYIDKQNEQTVGSIVTLIKEDNILIKSNSDALTIYYDGKTKELNQEQLLNKEITEIAICEDDENNNTLTIFIK